MTFRCRCELFIQGKLQNYSVQLNRQQYSHKICTQYFCIVPCLVLFWSYYQFLVELLQWHRNERHGVSNHRRIHCLLNSSGPDQRKHQSSASLACVRTIKAENISIWWRHHVTWSISPVIDDCCTGLKTIMWLPRCQWPGPDEYRKNDKTNTKKQLRIRNSRDIL